MNTIAASPSSAGTLHALLLREIHAAIINRYLQVFAALALLAGVAAFLFSEDANATGFFIVQIALYFVSLFAVLAGVSSAQTEREEWPLLLSQPVPRGAYIVGKFCASLAMFAVVLLLLFGPAVFAGASLNMLARLFVEYSTREESLGHCVIGRNRRAFMKAPSHSVGPMPLLAGLT